MRVTGSESTGVEQLGFFRPSIVASRVEARAGLSAKEKYSPTRAMKVLVCSCMAYDSDGGGCKSRNGLFILRLLWGAKSEEVRETVNFSDSVAFYMNKFK